MRPRIPRAAALPAQVVGFGAIFVALPVLLSRLDTRHGWSGGEPEPANLFGLIPLGAGAAVIIWAISSHYRAAPEGWELRLTPEYLLDAGPYALSRNPMYVGEAAIWSGWAALLGSLPVLGGLLVLAAGWATIARLEERALERRFGAAYDSYRARVPRWIGLPRGRRVR